MVLNVKTVRLWRKSNFGKHLFQRFYQTLRFASNTPNFGMHIRNHLMKVLTGSKRGEEESFGCNLWKREKNAIVAKVKNWSTFIFCQNDAALLKLTYFVKLNSYYKICRFQLHRCIERQLIPRLFFSAPSCTTCFCTWNLFGRHSALQ